MLRCMYRTDHDGARLAHPGADHQILGWMLAQAFDDAGGDPRAHCGADIDHRPIGGQIDRRHHHADAGNLAQCREGGFVGGAHPGQGGVEDHPVGEPPRGPSHRERLVFVVVINIPYRSGMDAGFRFSRTQDRDECAGNQDDAPMRR